MECLIIFLQDQPARETVKRRKDRLLSLVFSFFGSISARTVTNIDTKNKLHSGRVGMASDLTYSIGLKLLNSSPYLFDIIHMVGGMSPPSVNIWVFPARSGVPEFNIANADFDRYDDRLRSLENLSLSCLLAASLAAAGFHYSPQVNSHAVICHRCCASISLASLGTGTPLAAHRAASPICPAHGGPGDSGSPTSDSGSPAFNGGPQASATGSQAAATGSQAAATGSQAAASDLMDREGLAASSTSFGSNGRSVYCLFSLMIRFVVMCLWLRC